MARYNVTVGTDLFRNEELAIARAVHSIPDNLIDEIIDVTTVGGGEQQFGVSILLETSAPIQEIEKYSETIEQTA